MANEPPARVFHAALSLRQNMYVLAGQGGDGSSVEPSKVERFSVTSISWQQPCRLYNQCLPVGYRCMAIASDGENSYMFGGFVGPRESRQRCNTIYEINMISSKCRELIPATAATLPRVRSSCGMVCVNRRLVVYGGAVFDGIATDELFVFDLNTSEKVAIYNALIL